MFRLANFLIYSYCIFIQTLKGVLINFEIFLLRITTPSQIEEGKENPCAVNIREFC